MFSIGEGQPAARAAAVRFLPWALWLLATLVSLAAFVLFPPIASPRRDLPAYVAYAVSVPWGSVCALIGAFITSTRPDSRIGWLLLAQGLLVSLVMFASGVSATDQPAADALNVVSDAGWLVSIALLALFVLLFPDGRPLSPRWRPLVWFAVLWPPAFLLIGLVVAPQDLFAEPPPPGPQIALAVLLAVTVVAVSLSAVLRWRRSGGTERQQLKWFAYATSIGFAVGIAGTLLPVWEGAVSNLGIYGPLVGVAVALFRHRLYDIDIVINRTLVYGAMTLALAAVYVSSVVVLQSLLSGLTGGGDLAVAASTLAVAALFQPLRRRMQRAVDRRFYRSRYDATRTIESFSTRLRHEVDLTRLTDELSAAVVDALQPVSASVWLRRPGGRE